MRKLFEQLTRTLKDFYGQRDDLLLLVACGDGDVPLVLKALRDLDRATPGGVFLLFAEDFAAPDPFVAGLARQLQEELKLTNECVGPGEEKLPPLPAEFLDPKKPPLARLESGLGYAQSL